GRADRGRGRRRARAAGAAGRALPRPAEGPGRGARAGRRRRSGGAPDDRAAAAPLPARERRRDRPVRPGAGGGIGPAGRVLMAAPTTQPTTEPGRSSLRLLQLTSFVSTLDRFAMPSVLLAISRDLEVPLQSVVTAASVYYIAYGAMQPVWGIVSDRLGRVRTLRVTLLLAAVATAVSAGMHDIGALFGAAMPTCLIYVGDVVPIRHRQQEVTRLLVGVALGTALGAVGAGALAQVASWRLAFAITGACALALAVLLRRLPEP